MMCERWRDGATLFVKLSLMISRPLTPRCFPGRHVEPHTCRPARRPACRFARRRVSPALPSRPAGLNSAVRCRRKHREELHIIAADGAGALKPLALKHTPVCRLQSLALSSVLIKFVTSGALLTPADRPTAPCQRWRRPWWWRTREGCRQNIH